MSSPTPLEPRVWVQSPDTVLPCDDGPSAVLRRFRLMLERNQSALFADAGSAAVKPETAGAADASTSEVAQCGGVFVPFKPLS